MMFDWQPIATAPAVQIVAVKRDDRPDIPVRYLAHVHGAWRVRMFPPMPAIAKGQSIEGHEDMQDPTHWAEIPEWQGVRG